MVMRNVAYLLAAAGLVVSPIDAATPPKLLEPSGKWVIDFADHQCTAARSFGTGKELVQFVARPSLGGDVLQLALIRDGRKADGDQRDVNLAFSDGRQLALHELRYGVDQHAFRLINLDKDQKAMLAGTTTLRWGTAKEADYINVGDLSKVLTLLETCREDLRKHWNLTDELKAKLRSEPKSDRPLHKYFSSDDYPVQAIVNREAGDTRFVLLVDEQGKVKDCMVEATSGVPTLDLMGCIVVSQRAKFSPAIGADGKPVKAGNVVNLRWRMP